METPLTRLTDKVVSFSLQFGQPLPEINYFHPLDYLHGAMRPAIGEDFKKLFVLGGEGHNLKDSISAISFCRSVLTLDFANITVFNVG